MFLFFFISASRPTEMVMKIRNPKYIISEALRCVCRRSFNYMSLTAYNAGSQIQDAQIKPKHVPKIRFKI
jgi:hypothetical protein